MVVPSRKSRDRRRKKVRDSTRDSEEETSTYEEVTDRRMTSHDSGFFTSGINSALGARKKETVEENKKTTTQRKLVTEKLPEEQSLTQDYQNREDITSHGFGARKKETVELVSDNVSEENSLTHDYRNGDPLSWPSTSGVSQRDRIVNGMRDPSTMPSCSTNGVSTSTPRRTINDISEMASQNSELEKGWTELGARKKEKIEKKEQKKKPLTHRHDQNRDLTVRPGIRGVGGTPGDRPVNGMSSMATLSDHINTIIKSECLSVMKNVLTTALEKVEALESKATKRMIEYEQISPAETPKKKRELSPASSVESPILVTTVQRSDSAVGQYPTAPCPGTSGNHHPVDGNMFVQTDQSVHVTHQYSSILPVENCVFFEPVHVPEESRSVTSVTSSQWRQQWTTIDNDHHSVVSGVSSHWRQHRTTNDDDDDDSDNSGTKSPQTEKKSFFEKQGLSNADEEQPEGAAVEDLSCNLLECSISAKSPRKSRKGSKSSEMYEMSSVKINLMSTRSYVGSPSDRRPRDHVVSSPSRSQPTNANQRPLIRQPRLSLPATPTQAVYDAGARNCCCPCCGSVWTSELELEEHYFEHLLGNRSCAVGGCEYTCSSRNELRRHIRAAHLRKHTCRRCGKAYLMASTLERHLRQCLPCRQCPLCPSACVDDAALCDHVASAHGAGQIATRRPELRYYVCKECRFATTSRTVALDHCQRHILGEINLNITLCEICDLLFVTGDLHFLMHAVDDSFNRKSFQVVDFDWRVSLNARRQLESSLKKIQLTKALKASIDEGTSTARSNVEEATIETNDIVAPETETQLKSQEIYNNDSLQENYNNINLNQNEFDVTDKLIETDLSPIGESNNNMQDCMQKNLVQIGTVSKYQSPKNTQQDYVLEPVQSETLVEIPLEQDTTVVAKRQSNDNLDNNNQSLPSSSRVEVQNQNAALHEATSTAITNLKESNVETQYIMASPNEGNLESQVILNDKEASDDSVEEITTLQENNKHTSLDHIITLDSSKLEENFDKVTDPTDKTFDQCTVSENQLSNTTQKENILEANTIKEPVQSETLVERPLEQPTTVAMSQSDGNVDNNSQSLPSALATEVYNQDLDEETSTATNSKESNSKTNDVIALSSEMLHDDEARIDTYVNHTNIQNEPNLPKLEENIDKIKYFVQEIKELMQEANKVKGPVQSEILDELNKFHVTDKLIETNLSRLGESINKMQELTQIYLALRGTVFENQSPNTTQQEEVLEASTMNELVQSEPLVERPLEQHNAVVMSKSNDNVDNNNQSLPSSSISEVQNQNTALQEATSTAITNFKESNVETQDIIAPPSIHLESQGIINDDEACVDSVKENTSFEENKKQKILDNTKELNTPNSSKLGENLDKPIDFMDNKLTQCVTDSKNQLSNTTQQEHVLEASTMNELVQNEPLVERPLEQQTLIKMRQTNGNVENNQCLPCSSAADVQNQYAALDKDAITSRSNFEDLNEETNDIISLSSEMHPKSQVIDINDDASGYSEEQMWLNLTKSRINQAIKLMQEINLLHKARNSKKNPVQSEILVEIPVTQQTMVKSSELNNNMNNGQSSDISFSSTEDMLNKNAALDEETPTAGSNFEDSNVETTDIMSFPNELNLESQVQVQENNKNTSLDLINDLNEPSSSQLRENPYSKKQLSNTTQQEDEANMVKDSELNETLVQSPLEQQTTVDMSQPNTTLQEGVFEANTVKEPVESETLVERHLEQQNLNKMSQTNGNVENNKSLPSSSAAVQNQNAVLGKETSNARSNFKDSNAVTNDIMSFPNKTHLESQVIANDTNENNDPHLEQYGTDSKTQLSNTTQNQHILEADTMKHPEQNETLVERPLKQKITAEMSQSNGNVDNNKSLPFSLAVVVQNQNAVLNEDSTHITNFVEPDVKTNQKTVNNDNVKTTTKENVLCNDQNLNNASATVNQAYKNKNKTCTIENDVDIEKPNSAGEPKSSASKVDGSAIVTENEQKYEVNTNQTKEQKILIACSQRKEENNNEGSIENNDSVKVALSSIDINITISGTKNLSVTAEEANSQNVVLDKGTQTSIEEAMSSLNALEETNQKEVLKKTQSIKPSSSTEETHTKKVSKEMSNDETTAKDTKNSSSTHDETIIQGDLDKSQTETRDKESMSSGSPKEKTIINDGVSDKGEGQICIKLTKTLTITKEKTSPQKADQTDPGEIKSLIATETNKDQIVTPAKLTISSESHTQATYTNGETSSGDTKTVASTTEETYIKNTTENAQDLTSIANPTNAAKTTEEANTEEVIFVNTQDQTSAQETGHLVTAEETDTKQVLTEKPLIDSNDEKTTSSASANNENNTKSTIDDTQDHQASAKLTVISGSQTEASNANDEAPGEENKTLARTIEDTNPKDVAIENAKDRTSNATNTEHLVVTEEETDTKQVLTEKPLIESNAEKTISSANANNENNIKETIDETQDHQARPKLTVISGSQTEATNANDEASGEENKTLARTIGDTNPKDVAIENANDRTSNATNTEHLVVTEEETDTKQVLTDKPLIESNAEKTISSANANNENNIKETIDETQDHQARPKLTVISGSQTEASNANDEASGEENKTLARTIEDTNPKDVAIENANDRTSNATNTEHLVVTEEETDTKQVLTEKPLIESIAEKTISSANANNENNTKATIDETQDHQARPKLTVISGSQTEATNANDETSADENKTLARTIEDTNPKDVAIENAKHRTSNAAKITEEPYTKEVVGNTHGQTNAAKTENFVVTEETDTNQVLTEKPDENIKTNIKATIDETQDHQKSAKLIVISGSQTDETNANDVTSSEENKTEASTTEKTDTKDIAIEKAKDLTSNANPETSAKIIKENCPEELVLEIIEETYTEEVVFENTHGQINAKDTENFVAIAEENDTKQVLTVNSRDEAKNSTSTINKSNIKETKDLDHTRPEEITNPGSPAVESNTKEISEEVQFRTINEETKSSSCKDKTDSEEVLQKAKESQNQTSMDKTDSLEKTTKETGLKNHLQKTQDQNAEKSKQYEKNETDAKDETFSKTAATTSKKGQQARGRGRGNNNKQRNKKNSKR